MSANIIGSHLTNIINSGLKRNAFSDSAKVASIRPIFKVKGERTEIKNYRASKQSKLLFKSLRKIDTRKSYVISD